MYFTLIGQDGGHMWLVALCWWTANINLVDQVLTLPFSDVSHRASIYLEATHGPRQPGSGPLWAMSRPWVFVLWSPDRAWSKTLACFIFEPELGLSDRKSNPGPMFTIWASSGPIQQVFLKSGRAGYESARHDLTHRHPCFYFGSFFHEICFPQFWLDFFFFFLVGWLDSFLIDIFNKEMMRKLRRILFRWSLHAPMKTKKFSQESYESIPIYIYLYIYIYMATLS